MDATFAHFRPYLLAIGLLIANFCQTTAVQAQVRVARTYTHATPNFVVYANHPQWAQQVGEAAESNRRSLAMHWLGHELPRWSKPCPLVVQDGPNRPASGETKYTLVPAAGAVVNFQMTVTGTRERILDSVLPHEITHTIVASHFAPLGKNVPRWADEGMCTTVEHDSERRKHDEMLVQFLRQNRGLSFSILFTLTDYPEDILPLYAQGYSLSSFLIAQGGPKKFIQYLEEGLAKDDWVGATKNVYGYPRIGKLQLAWQDWVSHGGGEVAAFTANSLGYTDKTLVASTPMAQPNSSLAISPNGSQSQVELATANVPSESSALALAASIPSIGVSSPLPNPVVPAVPNKSMHPSTGSYYMNQFQKQQGNGNGGEAIPAPDAYQYTVGQPGISQGIGGEPLIR